MNSSRRKSASIAALVAALVALAGLGAAQVGLVGTHDDGLTDNGLGESGLDQAQITEIGEVGEGQLLFEETLEGETRHFLGHEVAVSNEPTVIDRNVVGVTGDGQVVVVEKVVRVIGEDEHDDFGIATAALVGEVTEEEADIETGVDFGETGTTEITDVGLGDDGIGDDHGVGLGDGPFGDNTVGVDTIGDEPLDDDAFSNDGLGDSTLLHEQDVLGGETAGIEGGQGEFEPNDQEGPVNELIAP